MPEAARTPNAHAATAEAAMRAVLTVLMLCLPLACEGGSQWSEGTGQPNQPATPTGDDDDSVSSVEAALTEGTVLVEEHECFVSVVRSDDLESLTFEFNCDPATTGIEVGGIVVGTTEGGYLRRVEEILEQTETSLTVRTSQAAIADAVTNATLSETILLDNGAREEFDFSGWTLFDGDVGHSRVGVSVQEGLISLDSELILEAVFLDPGMEEFQASLDLDIAADLSFRVTSSNGLHWSQSVTLWKVVYPFFAFAGPLPVVGHIELAISTGVWVQAPGGFETTVGGDGSAELTAGGWYTQEMGWTSVNESNFEFNFDEPEFGILTDFMVRPYLHVQPSVMLYSVAGPTFIAEAYVTGLVTGTCSGLDWHLLAGVQTSAGLKVNLFDRFTPSKTWPIWGFEVPVLDGYIPWDLDVPELCGNTNLTCGETVTYNTSMPGSGDENVDYGCTGLPMQGSEYIYRFRHQEETMQEIFLGLDSIPGVHVLVVEDQGWLGAGPYDGNACMVASTSATSFLALPDTDYWVIVDSELEMDHGADFALTVGCGVPPVRAEDCGDGVDNDWDELADCDDSECTDSVYCQQGGQCTSTHTISCGQTQSGNTGSDPGITNQVGSYSCQAGIYTGPEAIFEWVADMSGPVEFQPTFHDPGQLDYDLLVLDGSAGCNAAACTAGALNEAVEFTAVQGQTYYLVVDAIGGASGPYSVTLDCSP